MPALPLLASIGWSVCTSLASLLSYGEGGTVLLDLVCQVIILFLNKAFPLNSFFPLVGVGISPCRVLLFGPLAVRLSLSVPLQKLQWIIVLGTSSINVVILTGLGILCSLMAGTKNALYSQYST